MEPDPTRTAELKERLTARLKRYEDVPVVGVGVSLFQRDVETGGTMVGSALAFRLFTFFVPLLLLVVGLAGVAGRYAEADSVISDAGVSGGLATQMSAAFQQSGSRPWVVIGLGLFGVAVAGRSLSVVMVAASCTAWRVPIEGKSASWRVVGSVVGLVCCMGLIAALVNKARVELGLGVAGISLGAALALYGVAWLVISMLLPRGTDDPGAQLPGAIVVAGVIAGMHAVSQFYLPDRFERAGQLYGAIGVTVVTLGWFFILGRAIVLAMQLNVVLYERYGSVSTVVFALPVFRSVARRSARVRQFFDLPEPAG